MMMRSVFLAGVVAVALSGCGKKPDPQMVDAACPPRAVQMALANQQFINDHVVVGETPVKAMRKQKGLYRKATLEREGETLQVAFYVTGVSGCSWLAGWDALTPVVARDGVILGYGDGTLTALLNQGWQITEATWPWQSYHYGYLPRK